MLPGPEPLTVFLVGAYLLVAAIDWVMTALQRDLTRHFTKVAPIVVLIGLAVVLTPLRPGGGSLSAVPRAAVLVALGFGLAGDWFLLDRQGGLVKGLVAFLGGHVFYAGAALAVGVDARLALEAGAVIAVAGGLYLGLVLLPALLRDGHHRMAIAVVAYLGGIGIMAALAFGSGRPAAMLGGALFLVSDSLIGYDRFVRPSRSHRVVVMVTYHLAQLGLVLGLA